MLINNFLTRSLKLITNNQHHFDFAVIIDAWDPSIYLEEDRDIFPLKKVEGIFDHSEDWITYVVEQMGWFDIDEFLVCQHYKETDCNEEALFHNQRITHPSLLKFLEDKKHKFLWNQWDNVYSLLQGKKVLMCGQSYAACVFDRPLGLKNLCFVADVYTTPFLLSNECGYAFDVFNNDEFHHSPGPGPATHWKFKWKNLNNYLYKLEQGSFIIKETEQ